MSEPAKPLNDAYHGGSFKMIQSPARLLAVRTMLETSLDLKGSGLCRERHRLWVVPLLILQKNSPYFAEALRATRGTL